VVTRVLGTCRADDLNVGVSGTAGVVEIFPTSATSGKWQFSPQDNAANHTIDFQNASFGQATTLTFPDPGAATASFVLTAGTQTLTGTDKHTGTLDVSEATVVYRSILNADISPSAAIVRSKLAQDALARYTVAWQAFKKADLVTPLAATGDGTNLGLAAGTHGTNGPHLIGSGANNNSKTETTRFTFTLPAEYDAGETITIRCHGRVDVVANASATLDVQCYENDREAGISADLCATGAQSINSASWADKDFTITPTALVAGDSLDVELTTVVDDTGGGGTCKAQIGQVEFLLDIRG